MSVELTAAGRLRSRNPATGEVVGEVKISSEQEILKAVETARRAFAVWGGLRLDERLQLVERFHSVLLRRADELAELITRETGKPLIESHGAEIFGVLETCRWLEAHARAILSPAGVELNSVFFRGKKAYKVFEPLGVIAVISPWNFPFAIPVEAILNALAAGNTVVLKPSPKTPAISLAIEKLFADAGFPAGVVSVVHGDKDQAAALVRSDVSRVVFTGSVPGGKAIMSLAAEKLHPLTLELGGKHAAIVLADADLDKVAPAIVWGAFTNAGQACASIERVYAERSVADRLGARVSELTGRLVVGDGLTPGVDVGPMIDTDQVERVQAQVADAVSGGARILAGGTTAPELGPCFYRPTVLVDVTEKMRVAAEETFGPVLPIIAVDSVDEAIELANGSHLGLGASIWTANIARAESLARRLQAGMVWVNDGLYSHSCPDAPWGGVKASGFGRKGSACGLLDFTFVKLISAARQGRRDWYYPYTRDRLSLVRSGMELCHGGLPAKLSALRRLLPAWLRSRRTP